MLIGKPALTAAFSMHYTPAANWTWRNCLKYLLKVGSDPPKHSSGPVSVQATARPLVPVQFLKPRIASVSSGFAERRIKNWLEVGRSGTGHSMAQFIFLAWLPKDRLLMLSGHQRTCLHEGVSFLLETCEPINPFLTPLPHSRGFEVMTFLRIW